MISNQLLKNFRLNGGFEMNGGSKHLFPRMSCSLTLMLVPKPFLCRERAILLVSDVTCFDVMKLLAE